MGEKQWKENDYPLGSAEGTTPGRCPKPCVIVFQICMKLKSSFETLLVISFRYWLSFEFFGWSIFFERCFLSRRAHWIAARVCCDPSLSYELSCPYFLVVSFVYQRNRVEWLFPLLSNVSIQPVSRCGPSNPTPFFIVSSWLEAQAAKLRWLHISLTKVHFNLRIGKRYTVQHFYYDVYISLFKVDAHGYEHRSSPGLHNDPALYDVPIAGAEGRQDSLFANATSTWKTNCTRIRAHNYENLYGKCK